MNWLMFCLFVFFLFYNDHSTKQRFNMCSFETGAEFFLVGLAFGLAIYNGVILDVRFPLVVYKKLIEQEYTPTLDDLADIEVCRLCNYECYFFSTFSIKMTFYNPFIKASVGTWTETTHWLWRKWHWRCVLYYISSIVIYW